MLKTLQAGRGLAAVSVAAFHLSIMMALPRYGGQPVFASYTSQGALGVNFFFVLSGFIILFAHAKEIGQPGRWGAYLYRRYSRVYPIYWFYTACYVSLVLLGAGTDAKIPASPADWASSITLLRFSAVSPPLEVSWTLFHEIAFYGLFSILLLNRRLGIAALSLFAAACLLHFQMPAAAQRDAYHTYTAAFNLYFFFGMGAYALYRRGGGGTAEFGAGALLLLATLYANGVPEGLLWMLQGLAFAWLVSGAGKLEMAGRLRVPSLLSLLGDASYTIYLTHVSLQGLLLKIAMKLQLPARLGGPLCYLLVLAGTVALGAAAYLLLERPLTRHLARRAGRRRAPWGAPPATAGKG